MRILLFDDRRIERDAALHALTKASFTVRSVETVDELKARAMGVDYDVLLVGWNPRLPALGMRAICEHASGRPVVAVIDGANDLSAAVACGVHEVVRRPILNEELVLRLHSLHRAASRPAPGFDVRSLPTWSHAMTAVARELGELIGIDAASFVPSDGSMPRAFRSGTIAMSLVEKSVDIRASFVVDAEAEKWLLAKLLPGAATTTEVVEDALREVANAAGAAMKRTLKADANLTAGLPVNEPPLARTSQEAYECWRIDGVEGFACVLVQSARKARALVKASQLVEGMIVATDLRNESGALLVAAGTRLTSTTVERVRSILGAAFTVEVAEAA